MIEVIEERPKRVCRCTECNSKLSFREEDIINFFGEGNYIVGYIICPVCGEAIYVTKKSFDSNILSESEYKTNKKLLEFFK